MTGYAITIASLLVILGAFSYFFTQLCKLIKEYKLLYSVIDSDNPL